MREHGLADVRFPGAELAVDANQEQAIAGRRAEREDRLARIDVDEDLVAGGRAQGRAALAQRVCHPDQPHGVDAVDRKLPVRRMRRVEPRERVANGVGVPACVHVQRVRQVRFRVQARSRAAVLLERDEDRSLQGAAEAGEVGVERRRHHGLAVTEGQRDQLAQHDVVGNAEGRDGANGADARDDRPPVLPDAGEDVVDRARERHLRCVDRVHASAFGGRVVHADVVDVREQDRERRHELPAVDGARRQQASVRDVRELEGAGRHVAGVDGPVIAEERRMHVRGGHDGSVAGERLDGRRLLDGVPEALLEDHPDVLGDVPIDRPGRDGVRGCGHRPSVGRRAGDRHGTPRPGWPPEAAIALRLVRRDLTSDEQATALRHREPSVRAPEAWLALCARHASGRRAQSRADVRTRLSASASSSGRTGFAT